MPLTRRKAPIDKRIILAKKKLQKYKRTMKKPRMSSKIQQFTDNLIIDLILHQIKPSKEVMDRKRSGLRREMKRFRKEQKQLQEAYRKKTDNRIEMGSTLLHQSKLTQEIHKRKIDEILGQDWYNMFNRLYQQYLEKISRR